MRTVYTQHLDAVTHQVLNMGTCLERAIAQTSQMLSQLDPVRAKAIMEQDDMFDRMEYEIEQACLDLIATQAPVASDLRRIASIMRMIADLERIADHCSDIAEYVLLLVQRSPIHPPVALDTMFTQVQSMLSATVSAFVSLDAAQARAVVEQDDQQDETFAQVVDTLCICMAEDPSNIPQYVDYLMIAKYLERMSDHTTNLAHWIVYIVSGELVL